MQTHLPEGVPLFGKKLEVLVRELQGRERVELQVCPWVKKGSQVDKGVKAQPVISVVGQVSHENTDLTNRKDKINQSLCWKESKLLLLWKRKVKSVK